MKIAVTQKDIKRGVIGGCTCCPVALAAERASNQQVWVDKQFIRFYKANKSIKLPRKAIEFIRKYDNNRTVKPFDFELKV